MQTGGEAMNGHVHEIPSVANGAEPWVLESFDMLAVVRRIEAQFPKVEEAGCKVGIGVANWGGSGFHRKVR